MSDVLIEGPELLVSLIIILAKFRENKFAITASSKK